VSELDVCVIGAGPAGSQAAACCHRAGLEVRVVERTHFPRFVIGESLLPLCMDRLEDSGLLAAVAEAGYLPKYGAFFLRGDERAAFDFADQFTAGWDHTWQVPRDDFDRRLADGVRAMGVRIDFGCAVESFVPGARPEVGVLHEDGRRETIRCRFAIDASGFGRVLPRLLGLDRPSDQVPRHALFCHVRGDRRETGREAGRVWLCVHPDGGWIWIIPLHDGRTSVGLVGDDAFFAGFDDDPRVALQAAITREPNAAERLADAEILWEPRRIRAFAIDVARFHGPGWCVCGNAGEFVDPIFSSGVALALQSATAAADAISRELGGEAVDWDRDYEAPLRADTAVFRAFVEAWYDGRFPAVLFGDAPDPEIRKMICSVLAGYVRDRKNPFVRAPRRKLDQLARLV